MAELLRSGLIIGGVEREATSGDHFDVLSPMTEKRIGIAADADEDDVDDAVNAAEIVDRAGVVTDDVKSAFRAAKEIRAGSVHVGMHAFQSNALAPIGGYGMSGVGKSGGKYSTEEFTELKWVSVELGGTA